MPTLNERIARFYDDTSALWLDVWGDHMHHGFYGSDGQQQDKSRRSAQVDLIEELIAFAKLDQRIPPQRILDAGCGVGGSSRYLAGRFGAQVLGLTLSPFQAAEGQRRAQAEGADHLVSIRAQDIYTLDDLEGFDLIWSLESAEHMPDKQALLAHFHRLLRPGGTLALVTWCHRETPPALSASEQRELQKISELYHLPDWVPPSKYRVIGQELGFVDIQQDDWSEAVAPFWGEVIRSAFSVTSLIGLARSGPSVIKGAWAMRYMQAGFRSGLINFAVFAMRKAGSL